ncbi:MAG TPA: T9SS type A sorting domain-containing protein, partial [Candidatus Kapabacteria bacterium]|nr:T9SS type A sorting domain-containing protein [Candidatus Kapabacteria bacterium]
YAISTGSKGGIDWLMFRRDIRRSACVLINTSDIQDKNIKSDFTIYPNPASDYITINLNDFNLINDPQIQIFDILGNEFKCPLIHNSNYLKIDISNLSAGIYIIKLDGNLKDDLRKIIVKI